MTTRTEVERAIAQVEAATGPLRPFDKQHVAVPRGALAVLIEAAKDARYLPIGEFAATSSSDWALPKSLL